MRKVWRLLKASHGLGSNLDKNLGICYIYVVRLQASSTFCSLMVPSSSGLGRQPLTPVTGVRIPLGLPGIMLIKRSLSRVFYVSSSQINCLSPPGMLGE
jgi:hypothetical protein